jgi:hypothetical protein
LLFYIKCFFLCNRIVFLLYKVVQIWPEQIVTCLHTVSPGRIWTTLYLCSCTGFIIDVCASEPACRYIPIELLSSSSSPACRVFILIFLRQTMSLDNTMLQLFYSYYSRYITALLPVLNLLHFYISTFRSVCAVPNMAVCCFCCCCYDIRPFLQGHVTVL